MQRPILPITFPKAVVLPPSDQWMKQLGEAERLAADVDAMIAERDSIPPSLFREVQRHTANIRRKVAILGTRLDYLEADLSQLQNKQHISNKEMRRLTDKLSSLSSKVKEAGAQFTMSYSSSIRNDLIGPCEKGTEIEINKIAELDNQQIIDMQRQVMKEQDESLSKLEEAVVSTKHIALAINEELDLHTKLIDDLDQSVEVTSTRLQRVQKRLKSISTRMRKGSSCMSLLLSVVVVVICVAVIWALIKY